MYTPTVVACWRLFHPLVFWGLRVWFWCKDFLYLLCHPVLRTYGLDKWCVSLVQLSLFCFSDLIKNFREYLRRRFHGRERATNGNEVKCNSLCARGYTKMVKNLMGPAKMAFVS